MFCRIFDVLAKSLRFRHIFIHYFSHNLNLFTSKLTFLISCRFSSRREVIASLNLLIMQFRPTKWNSVPFNLTFNSPSYMYMFQTRGLIFRKTVVAIFANNQLDAQFFFMYIYFYSLHVSGSHVPIIRTINCTNAISGTCHSM